MPAGSYHLVGDGVLSAQPLVRFDVLWRHAGAADQTIVSFTHQYPAGNTAQYEESKSAPEFAAATGDLLVFKVTTLDGMPAADAEYIPIAEHKPTPTARFLTLDSP